MPGVGSATLDFGATPGEFDASVAVTGQTAILAGSHCEAFWMGDSTADHNADEHALGPCLISLVCRDVVAGTGFTIVGRSACGHRLTGQWSVRWVWA